VNSVVFQQVSLHAATAVVRRMVTTLGTPVDGAPADLYVFPDIARVLGTPDAALRAMGLSAAKIATLRRAGEAIASGVLADSMIEERPSAEAGELLRRIKGVGPWTASVILLRGFGRLDVFPGNDSGVAHTLARVAGRRRLDLDRALAALGPQQGMLYFHLLLARLAEQGVVRG
jgi:DNA-3-methyladenine glycosylase II